MTTTLPATPTPAEVVPAPPDRWTVLTAGGARDPRRDRPVEPRHVAWQIVAAAVVVVALVAVGGALVSRRIAQQQSVHDAAELTDMLATSVVQPLLTDAAATDPAAAVAALDSTVRAGLHNASIVRVKLWTPGGTVVYSDDPRLVGRTFALDDEAVEALTAPRTVASVSDLGRPENVDERGQGSLLETYRPVWTPSGRPLLLETYVRYDAVEQRSADLWRGFVGIILSSLVALVLLLTPVVWTLLGRARRDRDRRQQMVLRALESSDLERRRIAASLHDGVVQQLVGHSLDLAGRAERAAADGDARRADDLRAAAGAVRGAVGGLRSLLVEIHPPSLAAAGFSGAVQDMLGSIGGDAEIVTQLDDAAVAALSDAGAEVVLRVTQELVRNAVAHADARTVVVSLAAVPDGVELLVDDDGCGFDPAAVVLTRTDRVAGHLGLDLVTEAARRVGARLEVASAPGRGSRFRLRVPA